MSSRWVMIMLFSCILVLFVGESTAADRVFGKGVSANDTILISELLAQPEQYLDKNVRVQGTVVNVCKKRGCWMDLASDQEYQKIQIKVEDGEIIFPMQIMGETAIAEGVLTALPLTLEETRQYMAHESACQGEQFDTESITEAMILYRIQGTGAVVPERAETPPVQTMADDE